MSEHPIEECRGDQADKVKCSTIQEQQTRTRLTDNYETFDRVLRQMYGGE